MKRVYLDHNATTPMRREARDAWLAALDAVGGNPSSVHASGRRARHMLDEARQRVAAALAVAEDEIVFTSGATEANNLAILGRVRASPAGSGLVTTAAEHASVLGPARQLAREGYRLEIAPVDRTGSVDVDALADAARRSRAVLVSVAAANNEVGTCTPLADAASALDGVETVPTLHTDAVQALGRIPVRLADSRVGLASFSAHKLGGPVGVGVLFVRRGTPLLPLMYGGEQENGVRPGTENVPAAVAASVAIELAVREQTDRARHLAHLSFELWRELAATMPELSLLGLPIDHPRRLPGTLAALVPKADGTVLVTRLDIGGLEVSSGSACASGSIEPSHVLLAMGFGDGDARSALRVSLGATNVLADVREAVEILRRTFGRARATDGAGSSS